MDHPARLEGLIHRVKSRGLDSTALLLLDAIEPLAPVLAQSLWMAQPFATPFNARDAVAELAEALETPEGVTNLRRQLADQPE